MKYYRCLFRLMDVYGKNMFWNKKKKGKGMESLVRKAKQKDGDSFVQLMEEHMQGMYKTAWVYLRDENDVADAIQETILNCYEKLDTLRSDKFFKTWMIRILINNCNDILRNRQRCITTEEVIEKEFIDKEYEQCEWMALLEGMDEKYRVIVLLYYSEGLKVKEISKLLQLNKNTVLSRLARAREYLRKEYGV